MQLLRNTPGLRLMQMADIGATLILTALSLLILSMSVNEYQLVPYETIELVNISPNGENHLTAAQLIAVAIHGCVTMSTVCSIFSCVAAIGAACERRVFLLIVSGFSALITVGCLLFGIISFVAKGASVKMVQDMFNESVYEYTNFSIPLHGLLSQKLVDRVQFEGKCCGYQSSEDYTHVFKSFIFDDTDYIVCMREDDSNILGPQQIPFTCCNVVTAVPKDPTKISVYLNRRCTGRKFTWSSPDCQSSNYTSLSHNANGCEKKLLGHSANFTMIGALILVAGIITCLISALSGVLATNIVTPKEEVVAALCKEFDLTKTQVEELEKNLVTEKADQYSTIAGSNSERAFSDRSEISRMRDEASKMTKMTKSQSRKSVPSRKKYH